MSEPSVSVIVIARNAARTIAEALRSIDDSVVAPAEVIVLDGQSSDATAEIAAGFPFVRVVRQSGYGIANAYNEAIALAHGELLAFLSADDQWTPDKLQHHVALHAERPELLGSVSLVEHYLDGEPPANYRADLLGRAVPGFLMEALVVRPAIFERAGLFDPRYRTGEDTDWFARVRDAGIEVALIDRVLVHKRVHMGSASLGDRESSANRLRIMRESIMRKRAKADS